MTVNYQPSLLQPNSKSFTIFSSTYWRSRCSVFCKPSSAYRVLRYTQKDISLLFKRIGLKSQTTTGFKVTRRIRRRSLTDNLYTDCSDICLRLFFSPVVTAPRRNSRSWLTWLTLWASLSCLMWCTATHPRTRRTGWTALTAPTPVSSTVGPVEYTASGTADSSTTLGETKVCFSHFKHPTFHASHKLHGSLIIQHLLLHGVV